MNVDFPESLKQLVIKHQQILKQSLIGVLAITAITALYFLSKNHQDQLQASLAASEKVIDVDAFPITVPTIKYGFAIDTFQVIENTIQSGEFLGDLLQKYQMDYQSIEQLVANSKDVFDVKHLRVGKPYTILTKDTTARADYFIYEPSVYEYIVFQLKDDLKVERVERPVTSEVRASTGSLESSLWNAIVGQGLSYDLAAKMEDALQWSVDFPSSSKRR